jgi:glucosamine--fructose-6-phosphate aminotransferase (isomerizing)
MCGIMGYIGDEPAWPIVMTGLRRLEYRGYDSAGVVTVASDSFHLAKRVGPLRALADSQADGLPGSIGIGHTRWATHGGVSVENCHPHFDAEQRIAVVHNGIIDNAEALRAELISKGVRFRSETDTEVLALLIGRFVRELSSLRAAVIAALKRIEGTAGILVLDRADATRLIAARVGSPVTVGLGDGAAWVASDPIALRPFTDRMIVLDDGELAELTQSAIETFDLEQRDREKRVEKISHQPEDAELGAYAHFMLKEIYEQPLALDRSLRGRLEPGLASVKLGGLSGQEARLLELERVVFLARARVCTSRRSAPI